MSARANILARLRAAPARNLERSPDVRAYAAQHTRTEDAAARLRRFSANIEAAHAEVHVTDAANWPAKVLALAHEKGLRNLLLGSGLPHVERLAAMHSGELALLRYEQPAAAWKQRLFNEVDASLTLARSAIAETGSLILWPDVHEPRLLSLVPALHFVLLDPARIHADLGSAMTAEHWSDRLPTNALLISGPSKTADIQQTLAYGAHGPRELIVLICPGLETAA